MKILLFLAGISLLISNESSAQKQGPCNDINTLIETTVDALLKENFRIYARLYDNDTMVKWLKEESITDTANATFKFLYEKLKSEPTLGLERMQSGFEKSLENLKDEIKEPLKSVKVQKYNIEYEENDAHSSHKTIEVYVQINGLDFSFTMYATLYGNCYYVMEPLEAYWIRK